MKKRFFYVLSILILMFSLGGCSKVEPISEEITMELGQALSEDSSQFVNIKESMSFDEVTMDFSEIDFTKAGDYTAYAVYEENKTPIKIHIKDTIAPEVTLNAAYVIAKPNEDIVAEELFTEIKDEAETIAGFTSSERIDDLKVTTDEELAAIKMPAVSTNEIDESIELKETIQFAEEGVYNVEVAVQDASKNTATFEITVYIDGTAPVMTSPEDEEITINNAEGQFKIGIDGFTCLDNFDGDLAEGEQSVLDIESVSTDESTMTGTFLATVTATDRAGNVSEINWNVTVKNEFDYNEYVRELAGIEDEVIYVNQDDTDVVEPYFDRKKAEQAFAMVNEQRIANGITPLVWDESMYEFACVRAQESTELFSHTRPNGVYITEYGYGENLAKNYKSLTNLINGWLNSPGHREALLDARYSAGAMGCYYYNGSYQWCNLFKP